MQALKGADQWGSLLKIDREVEKAIAQYEQSLTSPIQIEIFSEESFVSPDLQFSTSDSNRKDILLDKLETFLNRRTRGDDLGLRLRGEQLTAGVRFIRMIRENTYDLVVGNPPYQGASKMDDAKYLIKHYPKSKADLYATFLERALQLAKTGGISALLTMRNWMFIQQYSAIREYLLDRFDLRLLGDVDRGGFEETLDEVVATVMSIFQKLPSSRETSIVMQPTPLDDNCRDRYRTNRKRAAILAQVGRFEFESDRFAVIKEKPLVYWWDDEFLKHYAETPKLGEVSPAWQGVATTNNTRFLRRFWEICNNQILLFKIVEVIKQQQSETWAPYIKGGAGQIWIEALSHIIEWKVKGWTLNAHLEFYRDNHPALHLKDNSKYFQPGIAFSCIGADFSGRIHRYRSIIGDKGSSVFPNNLANITCL